MFNNDYKSSKQYLDKQQNIDLLLVLIRIVELPPATNDQEKENRTNAGKKIASILEQIK